MGPLLLDRAYLLSFLHLPLRLCAQTWDNYIKGGLRFDAFPFNTSFTFLLFFASLRRLPSFSCSNGGVSQWGAFYSLIFVFLQSCSSHDSVDASDSQVICSCDPMSHWHPHIENFHLEGCREGSVGEGLAIQAWGPEFRFQYPSKKLGALTFVCNPCTGEAEIGWSQCLPRQAV